MIKRYNIELKCWEIGYYHQTRFVIVGFAKE